LDIAYQVLGDGAIDLVMIPAPFIPIDSIDAEPSLHRLFRHLSSFSRVIRSGGSLDRPESLMAVNLSAGDLFRIGFSPG
jgi:hypothetical protein